MFGIDDAALAAVLAAIAEGTATVGEAAAGAGAAAGTAAGTAAPIAAGGWGASLGPALEAASTAPATTTTLPAAIATEQSTLPISASEPIGGVPPGGTTYPGTSPNYLQQLQSYLPESLGGA